ncbi:MAG: hypothetical protein K0S45_3803, partial [Nitrospira sp.]|nr:hypothetical protein [Nitrospira sp.]
MIARGGGGERTMHRKHISELICGSGQHKLALKKAAIEEQGEIKEGELACAAGCCIVPIRGFVPRSGGRLRRRTFTEI